MIDAGFLSVNGFTVGASAKQVHLYVFSDVVLLAEDKDGQKVVEQYSYYDRLTLIPIPVSGALSFESLRGRRLTMHRYS